MRIEPFQAVYPRLELITSPDMFFGTVKEDYPDYKASGFFRKKETPCFYIYQIRTTTRTYLGMLACASIEDYVEGKIKKHEHTLAPKEQQQLHLLLRRGAMVKPVLLTYEPNELIDRFLRNFIAREAPFMEVDFEQDQQTHLLWEVSAPHDIQQIESLFERYVDACYIADGHHRTSITSTMHKRSVSGHLDGRYDTLLSAFFSSSEVQIIDFNRVVEGLAECSFTTFMALISNLFEIELLENPTRPSKKYEMVMYLNKEWFLLKWKPEVLKQYQDQPVLLDVFLLNELVIKGILGIEDVRSDFRVRYIDGMKGLEGLKEKVLKSEHRIGFVMHPIDMEDFMKISNAEQVLPPKSTWFEPRMRNGLIVQEFRAGNTQTS